MKSYREIADSVFARREQYIAAQRKKKQIVARTTVSVGSVALVSLAGFALYKNGGFRENLPVTDGTPTTTTTAANPTQMEDTTTATTTVPTQTEDTTTATATGESTTPSETNPTKTTATTGKTASSSTSTTPSKTEPSQTTTASTKMLITGKESDDEVIDEATLSRNEKYISYALQDKMELYEDVDVKYAVVVKILPMREDYYEDPVVNNEDLDRYRYECAGVFITFFEEAKMVNPSWNGKNMNEIEKWTDTMRSQYESWRMLSERIRSPYVESILAQRYEILKTICDEEPIDVWRMAYLLCGIECHGYYVEFTADEINALAEQGGYMFSLASGECKDVLIDQ